MKETHHGPRRRAAAVAAFGLVEPSEGAQALLQAWFDRQSPVAIVQQDLSILATNAACAQLLSTGDEIRVQDGRLACQQEAHSEALRAAVSSIGASPILWTCPAKQIGQFWVMRVESLSTTTTTAVSITMNTTAKPAQRIWADLSIPFQLTRSERRMAQLLYEGLSVSDAAEQMQITVETARTHIRRLYQKTGAVSREKLHGLLTPFQSQ